MVVDSLVNSSEEAIRRVNELVGKPDLVCQCSDRVLGPLRAFGVALSGTTGVSVCPAQMRCICDVASEDDFRKQIHGAPFSYTERLGWTVTWSLLYTAAPPPPLSKPPLGGLLNLGEVKGLGKGRAPVRRELRACLAKQDG